jgi:hypothetical protein
MKISLYDIAGGGVCDQEKFYKIWGSHMKVTKINLRQAKAIGFDMDWLAKKLLLEKRDNEQAWVMYCKQTFPFRDKYYTKQIELQGQVAWGMDKEWIDWRSAQLEALIRLLGGVPEGDFASEAIDFITRKLFRYLPRRLQWWWRRHNGL